MDEVVAVAVVVAAFAVVVVAIAALRPVVACSDGLTLMLVCSSAGFEWSADFVIVATALSTYVFVPPMLASVVTAEAAFGFGFDVAAFVASFGLGAAGVAAAFVAASFALSIFN